MFINPLSGATAMSYFCIAEARRKGECTHTDRIATAVSPVRDKGRLSTLPTERYYPYDDRITIPPTVRILSLNNQPIKPLNY